MRRGRIFFYLALIVLLGMIAVFVIYQRYLSPSAQPQPQVAAPTQVVDVVNVLVVSQSIPRGTVVSRDAISMVPIQRELFIQGMFTNLNEVEGRLAKFDLDPGIPLTSNMLVDSAVDLSGAGSIAALSIPRGMVAVAIPLNRLSNSYPLKSGDHVNVIVTLKFIDLDTDFQTILPNQLATVIAPGAQIEGGDTYLTARVGDGGFYGTATMGKTEVIAGLGQSVYVVPSEAQRPRLVSQNLLQDAVVLNVDHYSSVLSGKDEEEEQETQQPPQPQETQPPPPPAPDFLSLIVSPQDAVTLNYLISSGAQITLVLRSADDNSRVQTESVTLQYLLSQYNIPVPVKLPYGTQPRVDTINVTNIQSQPEQQQPAP